jgi:hypothetical protein
MMWPPTGRRSSRSGQQWRGPVTVETAVESNKVIPHWNILAGESTSIERLLNLLAILDGVGIINWIRDLESPSWEGTSQPTRCRRTHTAVHSTMLTNTTYFLHLTPRALLRHFYTKIPVDPIHSSHVGRHVKTSCDREPTWFHFAWLAVLNERLWFRLQHVVHPP